MRSVTAALLCLAGLAAGAPRDRGPNVLFILVDQQRRDGIGAYATGSRVKTPHLDGLAAGGILFNRAYTAQPVCAPNRGSIFSGLTPFNHGCRENTWDLDTKVRLTPDLLPGYASGYFGKWHLGDPARDAFEVMPRYPGDGRGRGHYFTVDGRQVYQTDVIARDVIGFLRDHRNTPFFAVMSLYPPHPPYSVPERFEAMYRGIYPDDTPRRRYYAMCTAVDDGVGRVLAALDALKLSGKTLVVYTTEHGHLFDPRWNHHQKRLCYDAAARIPMIMRFPGTIPAGRTSDMLINSVDLTPTMLGLLGVEVPKLDGRDLSAQVTGASRDLPAYTAMVNVPYIDKKARPHRPMLEKGEERALVRGNLKLILSTVRPPELYDLSKDPGERTNLWEARKGSEAVAAMRRSFREWADRTGDPLLPKLLE